jgi:hypothetical protein
LGSRTRFAGAEEASAERVRVGDSCMECLRSRSITLARRRAALDEHARDGIRVRESVRTDARAP